MRPHHIISTGAEETRPLHRHIGRTLEAPIPKMSGIVRKHDLFSKAFIFPPCFRAPDFRPGAGRLAAG